MFSIGDYVKRSDLQEKLDLKTLSDQELKLLQESILDIYRDVLSVCDKSGIRVMMVAGSAIGANTIMLNPKADMSKYILDKHYMRKHGTNVYYGQSIN